MSCLAVAKLKRGKFILDVRDIWPESAIQMGSLKSKFVIKFFEYIEIILYKNAHEIIVATPGMSAIIKKKLNTHDLKITYIPCGIDIPKLKEAPLRKSTSIINDKKFSVLYAGLHGHAQNLSTICETAIKLKENSNIHFYLIGDGPDKLNLIKNPKYFNLKNLSFYNPVSRDEIRSIFQEVSCALVPLRDLKIFKNVFPSKTFELWSYGVPTIVGVGGEIDSIIEKYSCGIVAEPDNSDSYKDCILSLYENKESLREISKSCRSVAASKFSYESCNNNFLSVIKRVESYD
jgi:glycosyltransferase involved in cell wall biosynthesis